ncbi:hypothetical protein [Nostoc sp. 'Peltigera malacea cyanobiont' DB3992]|uniref:hypothetical protein n=1 Tax=Nostoc sp. 'Peltigera malacea cyanobiont' DB3992 TaxID=1206980 RepID=UPI00211E0E59|nr:hypothetical protein [Nostoc sp. 'Peltigera malacea cyanobiont' DB3992]
MLHNKGRMRLIMGCQFSPQDLQAIQQGYELRDALLSRLDADLKPPENFAQLKHFEILSWLIQKSISRYQNCYSPETKWTARR